MAKQEHSSIDQTSKSAEAKKNSDKQSGTKNSAELPNPNLDTESEFAVNELREEKRDSE